MGGGEGEGEIERSGRLVVNKQTNDIRASEQGVPCLQNSPGEAWETLAVP